MGVDDEGPSLAHAQDALGGLNFLEGNRSLARVCARIVKSYLRATDSFARLRTSRASRRDIKG
jgi:hypothetical protein